MAEMVGEVMINLIRIAGRWVDYLFETRGIRNALPIVGLTEFVLVVLVISSIPHASWLLGPRFLYDISALSLVVFGLCLVCTSVAVAFFQAIFLDLYW